MTFDDMLLGFSLTIHSQCMVVSGHQFPDRFFLIYNTVAVTHSPEMYVFHYYIVSLSKSYPWVCALFLNIFKSYLVHRSSPTSPHGSNRIFLKGQTFTAKVYPHC